MKFYKENKINVIFKSPYISQWNAIELAFRALKRQYYQKIFKNEKDLMEYVCKTINSEESKTLFLNYGEKLREYQRFIIENKYTNLNSFNIE